MYITVASIKRNLGFKGLEINDIFISIPFIFLFLFLFCLTKYKLFGLFILIIGAFLLIPVKVSQKNRMYKVLFLIGKFLLSIKEFTYFNANNRKELIIFDKKKNN